MSGRYGLHFGKMDPDKAVSDSDVTLLNDSEVMLMLESTVNINLTSFHFYVSTYCIIETSLFSINLRLFMQLPSENDIFATRLFFVYKCTFALTIYIQSPFL